MSTLAGRLLRESGARLAQDWNRTGTTATRAWLRRVALAAATAVAAMVLLRLAAAHALEAGLLDGEAAFLRTLGQRGPFRFSDAVFFQTFGSDITLIILVVLTAAIAAWRGHALVALSILLAFAGADLVVRFGWLIWDRARPDVLYGGLASPGFHSFPSGHAAKTVAVYGILAWVWSSKSRSATEKLVVVLGVTAVALLVGLGRLSMGVHWPSDIVAGWAVGGVWLLGLGRALATR